METHNKHNNANSHTSASPSSQNNSCETVFALLQSGLWGEQAFPFAAVSDTDWDAVYKELRIQTVHNLPVDILIRENPAMKQTYFQAASLAVSNWYHLMQEQQALYQLFRSAGIPFVILKGATADCYYPQPSYRCMGDIDLLVKPRDFDKAYQLMLDNGYILFDDKNSRHIELSKNKVLFELHRCFAIFNNPEHTKLLDDWIYAAIDQAKEAAIETFTFPMLPRLENGLVLLGHISQHLDMGLGLRQIVDWMMFVDKELDDELWNSKFKQCTQALDLYTLAITVTRMCQIYLGLREDITWCEDADPSLCEELMEYILEHGNFGRKLAKHSNTVIVTVNMAKNIPALFQKLQQRGCLNWKALERYPWLKPFAWFYQICRYIYLSLRREHPFRQLWQDVSKSRRHESILKRLGATQRSKVVFTAKGAQF